MGCEWAGRALEENAEAILRGREVGAEQANTAPNPYFSPTHPVDSDAQTYLEKIRTLVLGLVRATESLVFLGNLKQEKIK